MGFCRVGPRFRTARPAGPRNRAPPTGGVACPDPLPARTGGGALRPAPSTLPDGRSVLPARRCPCEGRPSDRRSPSGHRSEDHQFPSEHRSEDHQFPSEHRSEDRLSPSGHRSGDRRFRDGGRCAARRSAAAGSPSGRPAAPRSPTPAPTTARRLSTRGPKPPLSHRSPGQCRVRPTARQPLRAQDSSSLRAGAPVFRPASPRAAGRNSPIVLPHGAAPNRDGAAPPTLRRGVLRRPRLGPGNQRAWRREFRGPWPRCRSEDRRSWPG